MPGQVNRTGGGITNLKKNIIAVKFKKEGGSTDMISTDIVCTIAAKTVLLSMDALRPAVGGGGNNKDMTVVTTRL